MSNTTNWSGIPLRTKKAQEENKKSTTTYTKSKEQSAMKRVQVRKGYTERKSEKEKLQEETSRLQDELSDYKENLLASEKKLAHEQERLSELQKAAEEKENRLTGEIDELRTNSVAIEERTTSYEKKLLLCNINPVTLESMEPGQYDSDEISKKREAARTNMELLKKRINSLNEESTKICENMKNLGEDIDKIAEDATIPVEED